MTLDISILFRIFESVAAAVFGALALRAIERRPRLVVFYGHIGSFQLQPDVHGPGGAVHTHSVVIRNSGKLSAHNVRVPHAIRLVAPTINVSVDPQTAYSQTTLPTGGDEILFATLVPGQQVTISYLYYPPLTWNNVNQSVRSDEGMARVLNVLPTPQLRTWQRYGLWFLVFVGSISLLYLAVIVIRWLSSIVGTTA